MVPVPQTMDNRYGSPSIRLWPSECHRSWKHREKERVQPQFVELIVAFPSAADSVCPRATEEIVEAASA